MHLERLAFWPSDWTERDTGDTGVQTATRAGEANKRHMITGFGVSSIGAIVAGATVEIKSAANILRRFHIPANVEYSPILSNLVRPLKGGLGEAVSIEITSPGGVNTTVEIMGFTMLDY